MVSSKYFWLMELCADRNYDDKNGAGIAKLC
jgi:hypothetical protein